MTTRKGSEANKPSLKKTEVPNKKTSEESERSIISLITQPFLVILNGIVSLIGFDSFFGVGIMIFLIFMLSYSLRILFTGKSKPIEKRKKTINSGEIKKDN